MKQRLSLVLLIMVFLFSGCGISKEIPELTDLAKSGAVQQLDFGVRYPESVKPLFMNDGKIYFRYSSGEVDISGRERNWYSGTGNIRYGVYDLETKAMEDVTDQIEGIRNYLFSGQCYNVVGNRIYLTGLAAVLDEPLEWDPERSEEMMRIHSSISSLPWKTCTSVIDFDAMEIKTVWEYHDGLDPRRTSWVNDTQFVILFQDGEGSGVYLFDTDTNTAKELLEFPDPSKEGIWSVCAKDNRIFLYTFQPVKLFPYGHLMEYDIDGNFLREIPLPDELVNYKTFYYDYFAPSVIHALNNGYFYIQHGVGQGAFFVREGNDASHVVMELYHNLDYISMAPERVKTSQEQMYVTDWRDGLGLLAEFDCGREQFRAISIKEAALAQNTSLVSAATRHYFLRDAEGNVLLRFFESYSLSRSGEFETSFYYIPRETFEKYAVKIDYDKINEQFAEE